MDLFAFTSQTKNPQEIEFDDILRFGYSYYLKDKLKAKDEPGRPLKISILNKPYTVRSLEDSIDNRFPNDKLGLKKSYQAIFKWIKKQTIPDEEILGKIYIIFKNEAFEKGIELSSFYEFVKNKTLAIRTVKKAQSSLNPYIDNSFNFYDRLSAFSTRYRLQIVSSSDATQDEKHQALSALLLLTQDFEATPPSLTKNEFLTDLKKEIHTIISSNKSPYDSELQEIVNKIDLYFLQNPTKNRLRLVKFFILVILFFFVSFQSIIEEKIIVNDTKHSLSAEIVSISSRYIDNTEIADMVKRWYDLAYRRNPYDSISIAYIDSAIRLLNPHKVSGIYMAKGTLLRGMGNYNEAIKNYTLGIELKKIEGQKKGTIPIYWNYEERGVTRVYAGDYENAILDLDSSISATPAASNVLHQYYHRGWAYYNYALSLDTIDDELDRYVDTMKMKNIYGKFNQAYSMYSKSFEDFQIANTPENMGYNDAIVKKGCVLVKLGRYEEAVDVLNKALKRGFNTEEAIECLEVAKKKLKKKKD